MISMMLAWVVSSILEFWRCCGIAGSERRINSMRKLPSSATKFSTYNCSRNSVCFHVNRPLLWSQKIAIGIDVTSDTAIFSKRRKIDTFCRYHSRMIDMSTSNVDTPISKNCPCCGIVENAIPTGTSSGYRQLYVYSCRQVRLLVVTTGWGL